MNAGIIAGRYAKTLLLYANDKRVGEQVYREINTLLDQFRLLPGLGKAMVNKTLSPLRKEELLRTAAGIMEADILNRFFCMVLTNKREEYLQRICLRFVSLYRREQGIYRVKVSSAAELENQTKERLIAKLTRELNGTVELTEEVNPRLIGGFILQIGDYRADASVASQLNRIYKGLADKQ